MLTVKVTTNFKWCLERQTPNNSGIWGGCRFLVNQEVAECDFWVVFDGLLKSETTKCPRENTLLITGEPPDVKGYKRSFLDQFGTVITCNTSLQHSNLMFSQQGLPWMIGAEWNSESFTWNNYMKYEDISQSVGNKTKLLSVIASTKNATPGHVARSDFIELLISELGSSVDVFGHGRNPVVDKWHAIAPYKYHLAIENSVVADYWTEKLSDALLGEALPIYHGCPNIRQYFPSDTIQLIDIGQPQIAIARIKEIIRSDLWRCKRSDIFFEKNKILNTYNIFSVLNKIISTNNRTYKSIVKLKPEYSDKSKMHTLASLIKQLF